MGVIIDILGSYIVRAAIIWVMLQLMWSLNEALYKKSDMVYLNEVMEAPAQVITNDLKLAGYNASKDFGNAQEDEMVFYADMGNDGSVETIRYYVSDKVLYRTINGGSQLELARSVTDFTIKYFNVYGSKLSYGSPKTDIKSINVQITIRSRNRIQTQYTGSATSGHQTLTWEDRIFPPNL